LEVYQNQVWTLLRDRSQCLFTILRLKHLVTLTREHIPQNLSVIGLVLDHQDAFAHNMPPCRSTVIGTVKENVEP
jgi:hypothetical protein